VAEIKLLVEVADLAKPPRLDAFVLCGETQGVVAGPVDTAGFPFFFGFGGGGLEQHAKEDENREDRLHEGAPK
jgi:hypothetical protein